MVDNSTLAQIASIIAGFGATMLFFRIQRELQMWDRGEPMWITAADWLLIVATFIALIGVVFPAVVSRSPSPTVTAFARVFCAAAITMLAGYIPSILAHYRLILGENRTGPRENPEPAERGLVVLTLLATMVVIIAVLGTV